MDAHREHQEEDDEQLKQRQLRREGLQTLQGTSSRRSVSSISSLDSQDSVLRSNADDRPSSDMDGVGDAYRRRRAQLMAGLDNGSAKSKRRGKTRASRQYRNGLGTSDDKETVYSSNDGHDSDFSSMSTSDDVELSQLTSGEALTDDEETGLTKKDKEHRKRKRRRNRGLDGRIAGSARASQQERKIADRNFVKAITINVLLILAWYLFSLSISIVSDPSREQPLAVADCCRSTTNGCLRRNISTFIFRSSQPVCICWSNFPLQRSSSTSSLNCGLDQTVLATLIITTRSDETPRTRRSPL